MIRTNSTPYTCKIFNQLQLLHFSWYAYKTLKELQMNFNAVSKNVKILKIGLVELKLWKKITNYTELINSV